jgi:hypothetical protein
MIRVRLAEPGDAAALATRLREADVREIDAATGEQPLEALVRCVAASDPCYAIVADAVVALFGVVPDGQERGIVWLVGSDDIWRHAMTFARNSHAWVARLHERYRILWNFVDARNEIHLRWLSWCGFVIHRRIEEHGVGRRPFYEFSSRNAEAC